MSPVVSPPAPMVLGPPTDADQLAFLLALVQQYQAIQRAISMLAVPGVTFNVSLSAPGFPGVSFGGQEPDPQALSALVTLLQDQSAQILPVLKAGGISP